MNIIESIDNYGMEYGNKIAHIYRDNKLTYKELKEESDALAYYIIEQFKDDKTPIIVYGHKKSEMLISFLACVKAGHAYVPIDSSLPDVRVRDIIEGCNAKLILSIENLNIPCEEITIKNLDEINYIFKQYAGKISNYNYMVKSKEPYYIIYTSGSTGKPKGVQITLSNLQSFIKWGLSICNLDKDRNYVFMNQAPFSFDLSVMDLYLSLASGSTLFSIDKAMISNTSELFEYFNKSDINIWVSTPSFAEMCLADSSFNSNLLPNVKTFLFCGETLSNACVERLKERFKEAKIYNTYGPTETTVAITSIEVDNEILKINPLPVGKVKDDCIINIIDSNGRKLTEGEKGEIVIGGDSVSIGYYKNEDMTAKSFSKTMINGVEKRCYRTGDKGYLKDGLLYYCGRIDFQVKLNGFRIELEDIENNLRKIGFIRNCAVLPVMRGEKIQYLTAVVTLNKEVNEKEFKIVMMIKNELRKFIPDYMIPRKIVIKDNLPMTSNGKVNRKLLMEEL